jgi:hypothetical protein
LKYVAQGLKPQVLCGFGGTTEVVPFHGAIYAAGSSSFTLPVVRIFILWTVSAFALLAACAVPGQLMAQTAAGAGQGQFPVGDASIALPAPPGQGMVELGNGRGYFDPAVPDSNRLMAAFVLETDVSALHTASNRVLTPYALVETLRAAESSTVSASDFKDLVDSVSKQIGSVLDSSFKESEDSFNQRMKAMNLNVQVTYGKPVALGTFFQKTDAYAFGMMAPVTAGGTTTNMVVGTVLLRVRNHVVFAYYYTAYKDEQTPVQVRAATEKWTDAILAANQ